MYDLLLTGGQHKRTREYMETTICAIDVGADMVMSSVVLRCPRAEYRMLTRTERENIDFNTLAPSIIDDVDDRAVHM